MSHKKILRILKRMWPIFKTEMLIFQSEANLDKKIYFGKITRYLDPEVRKMLLRCMFRIGNSMCTSGA